MPFLNLSELFLRATLLKQVLSDPPCRALQQRRLNLQEKICKKFKLWALTFFFIKL